MRHFDDDEPLSIRCVAVECRPLHVAAAEDAAEQPAPEDVQPPGTRILASSFKKDGTRYRPGERLEREARKWAARSGAPTRAPRSNADIVGWSRHDAKATLAHLMESLRI